MAEDSISISQVALAAHTAATQTATEVRVHREECAATRLRNEQIFSNIRENIGGIHKKIEDTSEKISDKIDQKYDSLAQDMEEKHQEFTQDQKKSNRVIWMIVGALQLLGIAIPVGVQIWRYR